MAVHFSSATNDEDILKSIEYAARRLKIDKFKDLQIEAIKSALKGQDVFVNLPTGYGKSVIFHALPLCADFLRERSESETAASREPRASPLSSSGTLPGSEGLHVGTGSCRQSDTDVVTSSSSILLVISPLVSLMRDQVKSLKNRGLQAIYLGDASSQDVTLEGGIPYVFMSPETVFRQGFKLLESSVLKENLCAIVVDESHCVVKWGLNSDRLKAFRSEYGRLAELRSMVPSKVPVIALTATSTIATREHILTSLSMTQPALITQSPDRSNIKYSVVEVPESETADIFRDLCNELKREGKQTARTIIFCRSHRQCSDLYSGFKKEIEDVSLFGMFHLTTEDLRKEAVLKSFADPNGSIRVLFATMAFGMGVDCRGVRRVFHLGPPEDIEDYVQESGRVGRDGKESHAVLVLYKGWGRAKVSQKMKEYVKNEVVCRRKFLMEPFEGVDGIECPITPHSCCDICTQSCECRDDDAHTCPFQYCEKVVQMSQQMTVCRDVSDEEREELHNRLLTLRNEILSHVSVEGSILAGADITSGIPICEVQALVQNCEYIGSFEALCKNFNFFGHEEDIWIVLRDTLPSCGTSHEVILSKDVHSNNDIHVYIDEFDSDTDDEYARAVLLSDLESDN